MLRFLRDLYFTGFALIFKSSHASGKTAGAVTIVALVEWLILAGISSWVDIFIRTRFFLSDTNSLSIYKLIILLIFFALYLLNYYILVTRGHGIKFASEFSNLKKSKKTLLVVSFCGLSVAAVAFFVCSRFAYRHFFHIT